MQYGMLINYGLCTGCQSCKVSCQKEKHLADGEWGIQVTQIGPKKLGGKWEWDYVPVPSRLCDLCEQRRAEGKPASCQLHCLANVIEIIPTSEFAERAEELGGEKITCYLP